MLLEGEKALFFEPLVNAERAPSRLCTMVRNHPTCMWCIENLVPIRTMEPDDWVFITYINWILRARVNCTGYWQR